jgi:hypothetical protein
MTAQDCPEFFPGDRPDSSPGRQLREVDPMVSIPGGGPDPARAIKSRATIGYSNTDNIPAPTRAAAFTGRMRPSATPIVVITTTRGRAVAENRARGARCRGGRSRRYRSKAGVPRATRNNTRNTGTRTRADGEDVNAARWKFMPLTMKKIGTRNPKPMASSLPLTMPLSSPRTNRAVRRCARPALTGSCQNGARRARGGGRWSRRHRGIQHRSCGRWISRGS